MERITSKQVISMMEAVAQVYEQPEVEQLDEVSGNPVMPSGVRDAARKRLRDQGKTDAEIDKIFADMDAAAQARLNPTPEQRRAQVERDRLIQQAGGGVAGEKAATERLKDDPLRFLYDIESRGRADVRTKGREALRQLGDGDIELGLKRFREKQAAAAQTKPAAETKPAETKPAETKPAPRPAAETRPAPKPQPTDQQKVRAEYDRLRYSKDPKERAQAVTYGRQMAAAGAAKKDFSGYQSAADAKKNLPAPAQRTSIADRLKAIRDMRAASQSRIAAQGGTPATPAAKPKPKVAPPPVPSTTSTSTTPVAKPSATGTTPAATKPVDPKNKKPLNTLNNGDPMERMTGKGAQSLRESYNAVYEERTEEKVIDEGIMDAIKKVGKAVLGPADQSPEAEAARRGARRPQGEIQRRNAIKIQKVLDAEKKEKVQDDVDLFDIIKGHFIEEGLTEEEALAKMLDLTDEERTEIIEGSCGSMKKKKKSKKGGY